MNTGQNLIFLISQPRAGSTLLQKILGGHSQIHTVSEPWVALHPLLALRSHGFSVQHSHSLAREATTHFLAQFPDREQTYFDAARLMLNHLYDAALAPSGKPLFLDKTPRYYFIVPELRRVFPDARFIFLLRNPLAVLASILNNWVREPYFGSRYAFRVDLLHDILTAPDLILSALASPGPNDAVLRYEDLVQSPAARIAQLCSRLRLPAEPELIEYGPRSLPRWAFGDQSTVHAEPRPVSAPAERWRRALGPSSPSNELARSYLSALGRPNVERLGYDYDALAAAIGLSGADTPPFLTSTIMTPAYGDSCDYPSQLAYFESLLRRFRQPANGSPSPRPATPAAGPQSTGSPDAAPAAQTAGRSVHNSESPVPG